MQAQLLYHYQLRFWICVACKRTESTYKLHLHVVSLPIPCHAMVARPGNFAQQYRILEAAYTTLPTLLMHRHHASLCSAEAGAGACKAGAVRSLAGMYVVRVAWQSEEGSLGCRQGSRTTMFIPHEMVRDVAPGCVALARLSVESEKEHERATFSNTPVKAGNFLPSARLILEL